MMRIGLMPVPKALGSPRWYRDFARYRLQRTADVRDPLAGSSRARDPQKILTGRREGKSVPLVDDLERPNDRQTHRVATRASLTLECRTTLMSSSRTARNKIEGRNRVQRLGRRSSSRTTSN